MTGESLLKNSVAKARAAAASVVSPSAMELVVLLMNPACRRFELLKLEFDSSQTKVSDLLTRIPLSATEPKLQEQQFVGVLDHRGHLEDGSTKILEAFRNRVENANGNHSQRNKASTTSTITRKLVLVAKPKGLSTEETMRLAKPMLTCTQVDKNGRSTKRSSMNIIFRSAHFTLTLSLSLLSPSASAFSLGFCHTISFQQAGST
jgi:hypothetical protein